MDAAFDRDRFSTLLQTRDIGRELVYRQSTGSTMDDARVLAEQGAAHGTAVFAEEQLAGRGRRGRSFESPAGENIYVTFILRLAMEDLRKATIAVPVAVCQPCRETGADARIKWPNDIWVGERKTCGMLIDSEVTSASALLFPGIGINVNGDPTQIPELAAIATSLRRETGAHVDREQLLASLCNHLEAALDMEPAELASIYRELNLIAGRTITVDESGRPPFEAKAVDLADDGSLVIELPGGERRTVTAADVSIRPSGGG